MSEQVSLEPLTAKRRDELTSELVGELTDLKHLEQTKKNRAKSLNRQIKSTTRAIEELRVLLRGPSAATAEDTTDAIEEFEPLTVDEAELVAVTEAELLALTAGEETSSYVPDHQQRAGIAADDDVPGESFGLDAFDVPDDRDA